jgi:hypothetical protein
MYTESLWLSAMYQNGGTAEFLNPLEGIKAYAATYQTGHASVMVVQDVHGTGDVDDIWNYDQGMTPYWIATLAKNGVTGRVTAWRWTTA